MSEKRESFGSRLGFILVSAGCAIGIGNVWKFPYLCGKYGGAAFILIYLVFLLIMGIPVMVCEFSIGRASRKSAARAFEALEAPGTRWHHFKWVSYIGCLLLMMYYTTVCGWMIDYCARYIGGTFTGMDAEAVSGVFGEMLGNTGEMTLCTIVVCALGFLICYFGLKNGVERITKVMMIALLILMAILAVHSVFLEGATDGIRFYLVPDIEKIREAGLWNVIFQAMGQAFFTLSIGIGAMLIFGSYIGKERSLTGEAVTVTVLDTAVALMAGFIIIPAAFAYGIEPDAGPSLIFVTVPNIFIQMPGGRLWGALFFVFLTFAALSTVIAVFENLIAFLMDLAGWDRKKSTLFNAALVVVASLPCVFGYNIWSGFQPLGAGSTVLDFEDFIVSNNLLPLGSLIFVLFCTWKRGWGWDGFIEEADHGKGLKMPRSLKWYMSIGLPVVLIAIYLKGYWDLFKPKGMGVFIPWMIFAVAMLCLIFFVATRKPHENNS